MGEHQLAIEDFDAAIEIMPGEGSLLRNLGDLHFYRGEFAAAAGMTLVIMYVMRRVAGYDRYFTVEQFWSLAKPLLSFSLLWFYFWWASFITFWYGRQPGESSLIQFLILDSWRGPMMVSFFLNFLGPLIALVWNPVRRSIWRPVA